MAVDVRRYKRQGEAVFMGDFISRIGKSSNPNENIGHYGEVTEIKNGTWMLTLTFHENGKVKTLNDTVK